MLTDLRHLIASWIAPEMFREGARLEAEVAYLLNWNSSQNKHNIRNGVMLDACVSALRRIRAQRTPGANATVKRMASIAEQALKCGEGN